MKKIQKLSKIVFSVFFLTSMSSFAQDRILTSAEIPTSIKTFVTTHFSKQNIVKAEIDGKEYEIKLDDRTELEFNRKSKVIKIDSKVALPSSLIPVRIRDYVKANYPQNFITAWSKEWKHQEVKLNNGIELEFSSSGKFLRIDQ